MGRALRTLEAEEQWEQQGRHTVCLLSPEGLGCVALLAVDTGGREAVGLEG